MATGWRPGRPPPRARPWLSRSGRPAPLLEPRGGVSLPFRRSARFRLSVLSTLLLVLSFSALAAADCVVGQGFCESCSEGSCNACQAGTIVDPDGTGTCVPDTSCASIEGCLQCAGIGSSDCGKCDEGEYVLIEYMKTCFRKDYCQDSTTTHCASCNSTDPRLCLTCDSGYIMSPDKTTCGAEAVINDEFCWKEKEDDNKACAECIANRQFDKTLKKCVRVVELEPVEGCYGTTGRLELVLISGRACAHVEPTNESQCAHFSKNSGARARLSATKMPIELLSDVREYDYATTREICFSCPDDYFSECIEVLSNAAYVTLTIETRSHITSTSIEQMTSIKADYASCYGGDGTAVTHISDNKVCVETDPTGLCGFIPTANITEFYLRLVVNDVPRDYSFDTREWRSNKREYCHDCREDDEEEAKKEENNGVPTRSCITHARNALLNLSAFGTLYLTAYMNGVRVPMETPIVTVSSTAFRDCFSDAQVRIYTNHVDLAIFPVPEAISGARPDCKMDVNAMTTRFSIALYLDGWIDPFKLTTTLHPARQLDKDMTILFYPQTDYDREMISTFITANKSMFAEFSMASLSVMDYDNPDQVMEQARIDVVSTRAGCFEDPYISFYADRTCFTISPLFSTTCVISEDLVAEADYRAYVTLVEETVDYTASNDQYTYEKEVVRVDFLRKGYPFTRDPELEICFTCDMTQNDMAAAECEASLKKIRANLDWMRAAIHITIDEPALETSWLPITRFYRQDYTIVYIVGACLGVGFAIPFLIHVAILSVAVQKERKKLKRMLKGKKKMRR